MPKWFIYISEGVKEDILSNTVIAPQKPFFADFRYSPNCRDGYRRIISITSYQLAHYNINIQMQIAERLSFNAKLMDFCLRNINWKQDGPQEDYLGYFASCLEKTVIAEQLFRA
jgi:hypothetical protein